MHGHRSCGYNHSSIDNRSHMWQVSACHCACVNVLCVNVSAGNQCGEWFVACVGGSAIASGLSALVACPNDTNNKRYLTELFPVLRYLALVPVINSNVMEIYWSGIKSHICVEIYEHIELRYLLLMNMWSNITFV